MRMLPQFQSEKPKWGNLPGFVSAVSVVSAVSGASVVFTFSTETSVDVSGLRICKASQL